MTPQAAGRVAAGFLDWMAAEPGRLAGFLTATGLGPGDLRAGMGEGGPESGLALAILDHMMGDETLLLAACRDLDLTPETPARAQAALGGGPGPHWT